MRTKGPERPNISAAVAEKSGLIPDGISIATPLGVKFLWSSWIATAAGKIVTVKGAVPCRGLGVAAFLCFLPLEGHNIYFHVRMA